MEMPLVLFVEVPICAFRPYASREYQDTFCIPPPSTVYGMLLALSGVPRKDKDRHCGVGMILAIESQHARSTVLRKLRRVPQSGRPDALGSRRPDYQDLLVDLRLWIWLKPGRDRASPSLPETVVQALTNPSSINRFGGLSLGESSYLVDTITRTKAPPREAAFLRPNPWGYHSLPVWVDHQDASRTRVQRFSLDVLETSSAMESCWSFIEQS